MAAGLFDRLRRRYEREALHWATALLSRGLASSGIGRFQLLKAKAIAPGTA
jgi:hypothetical protein